MTLSAYSVFDRFAGPQEGAVLVFARTAKDAKKLAWPTVSDWCNGEWINVATRWLSGDATWLAEQEGIDRNGEPVVIENPKYCQRCELWGTGPLDAASICEGCRDDEDMT